jgi:hypothetical protein
MEWRDITIDGLVNKRTAYINVHKREQKQGHGNNLARCR